MSKKKTEGGVEFPAEAFLVVPDSDTPSTWKLRIWESPEKKVTTAQLGRAAAALGPGFRGNKAQLSSAQRTAAIRKLRSLYRGLKVAPADMPSVLQAGASDVAFKRMKANAAKMMEAASAYLPEKLRDELQEDLEVLGEMTYYMTVFPAMQEGVLSFESVICAVDDALEVWHAAYHAQPGTEGHPYSCGPEIVATFPSAVVFQMEGKLYQLGYTIEGTAAILQGEHPTELTADFQVMRGEGIHEEAVKRIKSRRLPPGETHKPPQEMPPAHAAQESKPASLFETMPAGLLREAEIDQDERVLRGTTLITAESQNGPKGRRRYSDKALRQISAMAEGMPAYANHNPPDKAFAPRPVEQLIGRHRNVRFEENRKRVVSDLHILEHQAPWVFSLARDMADVVGNSVVSRGLVRMDGDVEVVEEIVAIRSGDLVSDPGATKGLFEHLEEWRGRQPHTEEDTDMKLTDIQEHLKADPASATALKEQLAGAELKQLAEDKAKLQAAHDKLKGELTEAQGKVQAYEAKAAEIAKQAKLDTVLGESDLSKKFAKNPKAITQEFKDLLLETSEDKWAKMIKDRVEILEGVTGSNPPKSDFKGTELGEGKITGDMLTRVSTALVG